MVRVLAASEVVQVEVPLGAVDARNSVVGAAERERLYRYTVRVSVTQTVQVTVEASSEDGAQYAVDQDAVSAAVDAATVDWPADCTEQGRRVNWPTARGGTSSAR